MKKSEFETNEEFIEIAMRTIPNRKEGRLLNREEAIKLVNLFRFWAQLEYEVYRRKTSSIEVQSGQAK